MTLSELFKRYKPLLSALSKGDGNVRLPSNPRKAHEAMNFILGRRF